MIHAKTAIGHAQQRRQMGPHYETGAIRIGRERLPPTYRALVEDAAAARNAIAEMHEFVKTGRHKDADRLHLVFRRVEKDERELFRNRLYELKGVKDGENIIRICGNIRGYWHVIDTEHMAHIWNRHADPSVSQPGGNVGLTVGDMTSIPAVIHPKNIVECDTNSGSLTVGLKYSGRVDGGRLIVVQELRPGSRQIVVKTSYKMLK